MLTKSESYSRTKRLSPDHYSSSVRMAIVEAIFGSLLGHRLSRGDRVSSTAAVIAGALTARKAKKNRNKRKSAIYDN